MSTVTDHPKRITTLDEFLDSVIQSANEKVDHDTKEFMLKLHGRIIKAKRTENIVVHDNVIKAYFEMYVLLRPEKTSRTRLIATAEAVTRWIRH